MTWHININVLTFCSRIILLIWCCYQPGYAQDAGDTKPTQIDLILTDEERRWIQQHPRVRLAVDSNYAPIEFIDHKGRYTGMTAEYVELLSQITGLQFNVVHQLSWSQALQSAREGKVDAFPAVTPSPTRKTFLSFTKTYIDYPLVIFTRDDYRFISGLQDLIGYKVAVVKDYYTHEVLSQKYPQLQLIVKNSIQQALSAVSVGEVDAFVGDTATATYLIRINHLSNLKIAAPVAIEAPGQAFAVRKDWPLLVSILNKALESITPQQHDEIRSHWIGIEVDTFPIYWLWLAGGAAGIVFLLLATSAFLRIEVNQRTAELQLKNRLLEKENFDRKRTEDLLIKSEQRLGQFFHATHEMVFLHDNGKILDVNPATIKITGYSTDELMAKNLIDFLAPGEAPKVMEHINRQTTTPYEANILTRDKDVMTVIVHSSFINMGNKVIKVVSLMDITELKNNREALQRAYDELEIKVDERTAELLEANARLKELDKLKSLFIASVSHELRTPLNSIIGFSSMMAQSAFGQLDAKYLDYARRINQSGKHLLAVITDIIDISKIESGRMEVEVEEFSLQHVIDDAVNELMIQANDKGLKIQLERTTDIMMISDPRRVLQCILNLLSNAVKYTEQGEIRIFFENHGSHAKLSINDTGIGVSDADQPRLFKAFERIDNPMRIQAGGTGLGLYLTKKIVTELLQGKIGMQSQPGVGSTFWIKIPIRLKT